MKPETKKRLDHMILMQRLKYGAMAGIVAMVLAGFIIFMAYQEEMHVDKVTASHSVRGTIVQVTRRLGRNSSYNLTVKLEDGHTIKTVSMLSAGIPFKGGQINLTELLHQSGNKNYNVNRLNFK